jgi:GNAT superfamily N-acetyltransferase
VRLLSRVVVDPRLRGCGVGSALLVHALPQLGVPLVECLAQMGDHCGFLAQAGFERHGQVAMPRAARRLSEHLHAHELDLRDLLQPAQRLALCETDPRLRALIDALANSRIQSGHGALRRGRGNREALVTRALCRLHAQPGYFLWRRPA